MVSRAEEYRMALGGVRRTLDACVVLGGTFLEDEGELLRECAGRGVKMRFLYPAFNSAWLRDLGPQIGLGTYDYPFWMVWNSSQLVNRVPNLRLRWHTRPVPAWFFLGDDRLVGTKAIDIQKPTFPHINDWPGAIEHYRGLFDELWEEACPDEIVPSAETETLIPLQRAVPKVLVVDFRAVNRDLLRRLAADPTLLYALSPRTFEEVVAELFRVRGYETILTKQTRDGGKDLYAIRRDDVGEHLFLIECKKYAPGRPVGVELVRALYGQLEAEKASAAVLVTTSRFTKPAIDFWSSCRYRMALEDFEKLKVWLRSFRGE